MFFLNRNDWKSRFISTYPHRLNHEGAGIRKKYVYEQTDHSKNTPFKRLLNGSTDSTDESQFDLNSSKTAEPEYRSAVSW